MKGFNKRGIYRMKQFYDTYKDYPFVSPLVTQISWTKRELDRQIGSGYYQRYMLSDGKANQSLAKVEGDEDYPNTRILDTYSLVFLL